MFDGVSKLNTWVECSISCWFWTLDFRKLRPTYSWGYHRPYPLIYETNLIIFKKFNSNNKFLVLYQYFWWDYFFFVSPVYCFMKWVNYLYLLHQISRFLFCQTSFVGLIFASNRLSSSFILNTIVHIIVENLISFEVWTLEEW